MEKLQVYRCSSVEWRPSGVVALATSNDGSQVAAAREDGSVEIWLVSPGSVGWHCQLIIQGDSSSRVSSLVWCKPSSKGAGLGRLLSSSLDGSVLEWDLFSLKQKCVLDSIGVSIWQMALEPSDDLMHSGKNDLALTENGHANHNIHGDSESSEIEEDDDSVELNNVHIGVNLQQLAVACDDGCVRLYNVPDTGSLTYIRSFPRVSGRILSVAWSSDAKFIFSGSSNGLVRCWNATSFNEAYCITAGLGGISGGPELCVWSLLFLRCGTLVSGDSMGGVQFWDVHHGTLLQAHTYHEGDVNSLATVPSHNRVFSAGSDGQVMMFKLSTDVLSSGIEELDKEHMTKWVYVGCVRAHTHDIRSLAMAVPISQEDSPPLENVTKMRRREKPVEFSYHKWAHLSVPMLISAGDDTKLFAYSAKEFTQFAPHDICPAPQRPLVMLAANNIIDGTSMMLVQSSSWLDVLLVTVDSNVTPSTLRKNMTTKLLARLKSKGSRKIVCSAISSSGTLFAYSDSMKPCLFELHTQKDGKRKWALEKIKLPKGLPCAHNMVFSVDSSMLIVAGPDRKIYIVDVKRCEVVNVFMPRRKVECDINSSSPESPITRMFTSVDGQWLAAVCCFGDIYIFDLETQRQHWFIYRMNDSSVTASGFSPRNSNVLVVTTSSNEVYVFDVEAKQLGEWSRRHTHHLPRRFQEFPGEVIGLSFPPPLCSTSLIVYSARAMCFIDFGMPVDQDDYLPGGSDLLLEKFDANKNDRTQRKRKDCDNESRKSKKKNFDFLAFQNPVLFVGHISERSLLLLEKRWMEVVRSFNAPVHKHVFGT